MSHRLVDQQVLPIMEYMTSHVDRDMSHKAGQVDVYVYIVTMIFLIYYLSLHNLFSYTIARISNILGENILSQSVVFLDTLNQQT